MATKRKTLPKEIDELLKAGDLEELKKRFAQCEPNALHINKFGSNIFSRTPMPREFAVWAKEQQLRSKSRGSCRRRTTNRRKKK